MRRPKSPETPKSEEELCGLFTEHATASGWTVYPECEDWDMLLVKDKTQIGVQAKLRQNWEVLWQALRQLRINKSGPNAAAILVPEAHHRFHDLCRMSRLLCFAPYRTGRFGRSFWPLPDQISRDYLWSFPEPVWTPPAVPQLPAGVPSPKSLTQWRVKAIRMCRQLRRKGFVTTRTFKLLGMSPSTWVNRWIIASGEKYKGRIKYILRTGAILPDEGFESLKLPSLKGHP